MLGFFKTLLKRATVSKNPKQDVNATVDFLETVVVGHWVACACKILGISDPIEKANLPAHLNKSSAREKLEYITSLSKQVVDKSTIVDCSFADSHSSSHDLDKVFNYTKNLCHFASLMMEFRDTWGEGDGNRVLRCWRLFLPHFIVS